MFSLALSMEGIGTDRLRLSIEGIMASSGVLHEEGGFSTCGPACY